MKKNIPSPIARKIWLLAGCITALIVAGVIWGIVASDKTIMMLSFAMLIAGIAKTLSLYQVATEGNFEVYVGTILVNRVVPLRKRHEVQIVNDDGDTYQLYLNGRSALRQGEYYRLYIQKEPDGIAALNLPDSMRPARTLLGSEHISTRPLA